LLKSVECRVSRGRDNPQPSAINTQPSAASLFVSSVSFCKKPEKLARSDTPTLPRSHAPTLPRSHTPTPPRSHAPTLPHPHPPTHSDLRPRFRYPIRSDMLGLLARWRFSTVLVLDSFLRQQIRLRCADRIWTRCPEDRFGRRHRTAPALLDSGPRRRR